MRRRTVMIMMGVLTVGGLGASLVAVFRPFEEGPRYKGMPVSYWKGAVTNYKQRRSPHLMEHLEAFVGLRDKSGIPAIYNAAPSESFPILLRLVFDNDPNVREGVLPWLVSQNERMQLGDAALLRETVKVLREIDPRAVPMLLMLLKEESVSAEAAEALRQIDPEAAKRGGG